MDYSIRDVSDFLHLSREMIRYYEKWGVLTPKRNEQNNYRSYTILDVFMLLDAIQYKSWGIPVKSTWDACEKENFWRRSAVT